MQSGSKYFFYGVGIFIGLAIGHRLFNKSEVKQHFAQECPTAPLHSCLVTKVYYEGNVIKQDYDIMPTVNDSLAQKRLADGNASIKIIKAQNK